MKYTQIMRTDKKSEIMKTDREMTYGNRIFHVCENRVELGHEEFGTEWERMHQVTRRATRPDRLSLEALAVRQCGSEELSCMDGGIAQTVTQVCATIGASRMNAEHK